MSLSPGDVVCVIRSSCKCEENKKSIGRIFQLNLMFLITGQALCGACGKSTGAENTILWIPPEMEKSVLPAGYLSWQLRKIPPLGELEADTVSNIIPAYYREKTPA